MGSKLVATERVQSSKWSSFIATRLTLSYGSLPTRAFPCCYPRLHRNIETSSSMSQKKSLKLKMATIHPGKILVSIHTKSIFYSSLLLRSCERLLAYWWRKKTLCKIYEWRTGFFTGLSPFPFIVCALFCGWSRQNSNWTNNCPVYDPARCSYQQHFWAGN